MHLIALQHNRPVRVSGAARIDCVTGIVWLTRTRGAGDVFLRAGESCRIDGNDAALVEALGVATVRVRRVSPAWRRIPGHVAGVLSSIHGRLRTVRFTRWRTPLAG
jgi:hypothetical protein